MTIADGVFHNIYLLQELFLHAKPQRRYCDLTSGNDIAAKGLTKLLQLKAVNENDLSFTTRAMDLAARYGHLTTVVYLHENRSELCSRQPAGGRHASGAGSWQGCTVHTMDYAAKKGHLPVVKWLYKNRCGGYLESAIKQAANNNQFTVVRWLYAHTPVMAILQNSSDRYKGDRYKGYNTPAAEVDRFIEKLRKIANTT